MFFLANLILWCVQQLGMTLGVGAETIMLAAYLISMRDGVVDEKETQYARAIKRVMSVALMLIVISGIGITVLYGMAGESSIFTLAFFFKWFLIILAVACTGLRKRFPTASLVEGFIGGTWYALFLVHILNPATSLFNLGVLYAVWLVGFVICWEVLVLVRRDKKVKPVVKKTAPQSVPLPVAKPAATPSPVPVIEAVAPKPTITLAPDIPHVVPFIPVPAPQPMPPPPMPPKATVINQEEKITPIAVQSGMSAPSPSHKVTDTPFLPAVPALQPIPTIPETTLVTQAPTLAPTSNLTTPPGGTSTPGTSAPPSVQPADGLSAVMVMPKKPI